MSIFNKDHYPTPLTVIMQMTQGIDFVGKHVLEPSAGAGNIVDYLKDEGAYVSSCEIVEDLAKIVAGKSKFIKANFLEVRRDEVSHMDYIIMNPPFSDDVDHILHAWELAPDGCQIIALCNYQSIHNCYTVKRSKLADIVSKNGHSENLGSVFATDAERTTGVEVGIIHLYKPDSENTFDGFFEEDEDEYEDQGYGIMQYNVVRDVVQRYVSACRLYDEVAANAVRMNDTIGLFGVDKLSFTLKQDQKERSVQDFKIELQKKCWKWIFEQMNMNKFLTSKLREKINAQIEKQTKVPFTMKNIYKMFEMVVGTTKGRMDEVFVEVFDRLTKHYHDNRFVVEGWKTNSHYMVNQKFILEGFKNHYSFSSNKDLIDLPYQSGSCELMTDFVKALNYMTGNKFFHDFYQHFSKKEHVYGVWYDWTYFEVKLFKKGSGHFKFKSKADWELFNRNVAEAKGFELPENL